MKIYKFCFLFIIGCQNNLSESKLDYNSTCIIAFYNGTDPDENGQIKNTHSISAGLDYPGVGCEHSYLKESGRANYVTINDAEALEGFKLLSNMEGIIPALESAHAIAHIAKIAPQMKKEETILVCLSGRGDKDVNQVADRMGVSL